MSFLKKILLISLLFTSITLVTSRCEMVGEKSAGIVDVSGVQTIFTYTGEAQSISGATGSGTISYLNNSFTDAGTYSVTVIVAESDDHLATSTTVDVTVNKAQLTEPTITGTYTYNGSDITATYNGYNAEIMSISGDIKGTNAGDYVLTFSIIDTANYEWAEGSDGIITWLIAKATYDMSGAKWNYTESFMHNGSVKTVYVTGLPIGVTVNEYINNSFIEVGSYTASVILNYDISGNYYEPIIEDLNWEILLTIGLIYQYDSNIDGYIVSAGDVVSNSVIIPSNHDDGINGLKTVKGIGISAFDNLDNIDSVIIPDTIEKIGQTAFSDCVNLRYVMINRPGSLGVVDAGQCIFLNCFGVKVYVPETSLDAYKSASSWSSYSSIIYSQEIIDDNGFAMINDQLIQYVGYENLITIPSYVKNIEDLAFANVTGDVEFAEGSIITELNAVDFRYYKGSKITIPSGVNKIKELVFSDCNNLENIFVAENNDFFISIDGVLFSKDLSTIIQYPIGREDVDYTIPDGVVNIGISAFEDSILTNIIIPDSVVNIHTDAFYSSCINSIIMPASLEIIGIEAFGFCRNLTVVALFEGVISIGGGAFTECDNLSSIIIPSSVSEMGPFVFQGCNNLENIIVDPNNTVFKSIDGNLYNKEGTELIHYAVGKHNTSFTIPDNVTSIGDYAFCICANLISVIISDSVINIGRSAFHDCHNLINVELSDSVESIGENAFANCRSLTYISIPASVKRLGSFAFTGCENLTDITFEEGSQLTILEDHTFFCCSKLTSVTIPQGVTSIGTEAFHNCTCLTILTLESSIPPTISENTFLSTINTLKIYVPSESVNAYKTAEGWSVYADKIYAIED